MSGNSAVDRGGGIYADGVSLGTAPVTIHNSTLSGNQAGVGGGIYLYNAGGGYATLTVSHTLFAHGSLGQNIQRLGATVTNLGYNLSDDTSTVPFATTTNLMLGPLTNNGGQTPTHAPLPGSPAIDAGNPSFARPPFSDQRGAGFLRICNGRVDIGAVETQVAFPPVLMNSTWDASSGRFRFTFTNISEANFSVLTTTNPAQPLGDWSVSSGILEISPGQYQYTDTNAVGLGPFFYRVGVQ